MKKIVSWIIFFIALVVIIIGGWAGLSWGLGALVGNAFDLKNYGPTNYISFGSFLLVLIILVNLVTIGAVGWGLFSYGRARGLIKKLGKKE
jgi:hypothetical protein